VRTLLDLDHATFYREVYAAAHRPGGVVEVSTATQTFTPNNVGELLELLELFAGRSAEDALRRLGAFLPHDHRVELTAKLLETATSTAQAHTVDADAFRGMLANRRSYESARDLYLSHFFSREALIADSVERFLEEHDFDLPGLAADTATRVLRRLFRSHVLDLPTVLVGIGLRLFEIAVAAGYARRPEDEARDHARRRAGERDRASNGSADARAWACRVLELAPSEATEPSVKRQYKKLMLRFHPDVNPRGLRRAQELNQAYALLLGTG
jgi:hypothetical protein